jgi:hypothetical protein
LGPSIFSHLKTRVELTSCAKGRVQKIDSCI